MAYPIHQANENSPYGDLTREDFYNKHNLLIHQSFTVIHPSLFVHLTSRVMDTLTVHRVKYPVSMLLLMTALNYLDSVRVDHQKLPPFLYGESLGGARAMHMLICLKRRSEWNGLIQSGAMCGVSSRFRPVWPCEKNPFCGFFFAPTWGIGSVKTPRSKSYKGEWKRKLVAKSPKRVACGKPQAVTALEMLRACDYMQRNCHKIEVPLLIVHGGDDMVCDPECAEFVYESAASKDKSLKIFEGMWHTLIGEPNDSVELVFGTIL